MGFVNLRIKTTVQTVILHCTQTLSSQTINTTYNLSATGFEWMASVYCSIYKIHGVKYRHFKFASYGQFCFILSIFCPMCVCVCVSGIRTNSHTFQLLWNSILLLPVHIKFNFVVYLWHTFTESKTCKCLWLRWPFPINIYQQMNANASRRPFLASHGGDFFYFLFLAIKWKYYWAHVWCLRVNSQPYNGFFSLNKIFLWFNEIAKHKLPWFNFVEFYFCWFR